jgi:hypothetical protein
LIVVQPEPPITESLAKNPILFAKVVNDVQLTLVHPSGKGKTLGGKLSEGASGSHHRAQ